uniref:Uncharacterized protein n=1 Tax=viral metagenome TaxID=1070528 RepID=A0A6C0K2C4_9ZZZZ
MRKIFRKVIWDRFFFYLPIEEKKKPAMNYFEF